MIEAINYNLPVISSRSFGGVNDILKNGKYGFLYDIRDYINLARLIKKYISNQKIFHQKAKLAKYNLKSFSFSKSIQKYEKVLDSI